MAMSRRSDLVVIETASSAAFAKQSSPEAPGVAAYLDPYDAEKAVGGEA
jgi:hypothetical protein